MYGLNLCAVVMIGVSGYAIFDIVQNNGQNNSSLKQLHNSKECHPNAKQYLK